MTSRSQYAKWRKADLVARVVELEAAVEGPSVLESVRRLALDLGGSLTAQQQVDLAAARVLAKTLDTGPELPQAGISKQLADLVGRLTPEAEEGGGFLDQLAARRAATAENPGRTG